MRTPRLVVSAVAALAIAAAAPAFAASGSGGGGGAGGGGAAGGGGTTVKNGAIRQVSGAAVCDGTSNFGVTLRKGFDSRVELQFAPTGPDLATGRWTVRTRAIELDRDLGGMGTSLISGSLVTSLQAGVPVGTWTIRFTAQRSTPGDLITDPTATVLESCTRDFVVIAR